MVCQRLSAARDRWKGSRILPWAKLSFHKASGKCVWLLPTLWLLQTSRRASRICGAVRSQHYQFIRSTFQTWNRVSSVLESILTSFFSPLEIGLDYVTQTPWTHSSPSDSRMMGFKARTNIPDYQLLIKLKKCSTLITSCPWEHICLLWKYLHLEDFKGKKKGKTDKRKKIAERKQEKVNSLKPNTSGQQKGSAGKVTGYASLMTRVWLWEPILEDRPGSQGLSCDLHMLAGVHMHTHSHTNTIYPYTYSHTLSIPTRFLLKTVVVSVNVLSYDKPLLY